LEKLLQYSARLDFWMTVRVLKLTSFLLSERKFSTYLMRKLTGMYVFFLVKYLLQINLSVIFPSRTQSSKRFRNQNFLYVPVFLIRNTFSVHGNVTGFTILTVF
jgi:hypothetical protein